MDSGKIPALRFLSRGSQDENEEVFLEILV